MLKNLIIFKLKLLKIKTKMIKTMIKKIRTKIVIKTRKRYNLQIRVEEKI